MVLSTALGTLQPSPGDVGGTNMSGGDREVVDLTGWVWLLELEMFTQCSLEAEPEGRSQATPKICVSRTTILNYRRSGFNCEFLYVLQIR